VLSVAVSFHTHPHCGNGFARGFFFVDLFPAAEKKANIKKSFLFAFKRIKRNPAETVNCIKTNTHTKKKSDGSDRLQASYRFHRLAEAAP
jgi:hypothetical protein